MSERTEKAHKALADACEEFEKVDDTSAMERVRFLLDVAAVQAGIARAEAIEQATERILYELVLQRKPFAVIKPAPGVQVTPYHPWTGPTTHPPYPPATPTWAERTGLDHANGISDGSGLDPRIGTWRDDSDG